MNIGFNEHWGVSMTSSLWSKWLTKDEECAQKSLFLRLCKSLKGNYVGFGGVGTSVMWLFLLLLTLSRIEATLDCPNPNHPYVFTAWRTDGRKHLESKDLSSLRVLLWMYTPHERNAVTSSAVDLVGCHWPTQTSTTRCQDSFGVCNTYVRTYRLRKEPTSWAVSCRNQWF